MKQPNWPLTVSIVRAQRLRSEVYTDGGSICLRNTSLLTLVWHDLFLRKLHSYCYSSMEGYIELSSFRSTISIYLPNLPRWWKYVSVWSWKTQPCLYQSSITESIAAGRVRVGQGSIWMILGRDIFPVEAMEIRPLKKALPSEEQMIFILAIASPTKKVWSREDFGLQIGSV